MSRAAVEWYAGEGEPPCTYIVVIPKEWTNNNFNLDVQFLSGTVLSSTNKIRIFRVAEQNLNDRLSAPSQGNLMHQ